MTDEQAPSPPPARQRIRPPAGFSPAEDVDRLYGFDVSDGLSDASRKPVMGRVTIAKDRKATAWLKVPDGYRNLGVAATSNEASIMVAKAYRGA